MRQAARAACLLGFALALVCQTAPAASSRPLGLAADLPTAFSGLRTPDIASGLATATATGITYQGGAVLHANRTHLIFWTPANRPDLKFDHGYIPLVGRFMADVARASHSTRIEYGITGQYRDAGGAAAYASTYAGTMVDRDPAPGSACTEPPPPTGPPAWTTCLTDAQLQHELGRFIAAHNLPVGPPDIYFLLTPDNFGSCAATGPSECALGGSDGGYCGYHSVTGNGILYAVIPYNAVPGHCRSGNPRPNGNAADPALSTISHEQAETVTDPYGDAWVNSNGAEIGDLCLNRFGPALGGAGSSQWNETVDGQHYWLQELFSRITGACAARPKPDSVRIRFRTAPVAGRSVGLVATARQPGGRIVSFNWNFGDGTGGRRRRPTHTYKRAGVYRVYLRVTDSADNWGYAKRTVTVKRHV